jgi:long-chain acyl-CoA synthetase
LNPDETLPKLLRKRAEEYGAYKVAMRQKKFGIWEEYSWREYYEKVKYFCLGLLSLGLDKSDKIAILGENKPEWFWAELAAQSLGAVAIGIFTDCTPSEVKYYMEHSDSKMVIVHDQEQVDKLLDIKNDLPLLTKVIYWDPKGLWDYNDPILMSFDNVLKLGMDYDNENPGAYERVVDEGSGSDIAVLCYTSGTTGDPKAAMLSHHNLIFSAFGWCHIDRFKDTDDYLSFVPPAWVTEQLLGVTCSLISGFNLNFPEEPETVQEDICEIGPHILFYGPRLWENVNRMIQSRIMDSSFTRRFLYNLFLRVAYRLGGEQQAETSINIIWKILNYFGYWIVFRPLRNKLGLLRVRKAYLAGAAISPDIIIYFHAVGVNVKQMYGGSEQGIVSIHRDHDIKPHSSGKIMPQVEVRLSSEGEILVAGDGLFKGYYKNEKATKEKITDGWFFTGDFGYIDDDDHLIVIDRMDDVSELADDHKFSPQYVEVRLRFSPFIKDCLALGGPQKKFIGLLVNIDIENVGLWAETRHINYTTFTDLSQKPQVIELIKQEIEKVNETLPDWNRVHRFINLQKEFDPDEAELTRTRKLRRTFVEERFKDLIQAIYSDQDDILVETEVVYRDGRKGLVKTNIHITNVGERKS